MPKIIWTNHANQRLKDRKITSSQVTQTINSPDSKIKNNDGSVELSREFGQQKVHAVVKENENGELILLSCWINPPNTGSMDHKKNNYYKNVKKSKGIKKFWYTLLNQLGF